MASSFSVFMSVEEKASNYSKSLIDVINTDRGRSKMALTAGDALEQPPNK
jgi:hypothetical protein